MTGSQLAPPSLPTLAEVLSSAYSPSPEARSGRELLMTLFGLLPGLQAAGLEIEAVASRAKILNEERSTAKGVDCYDLGAWSVELRISGRLE